MRGMGCGMRRSILLLVLAAMAVPAYGAKRATVAQLEQLLSHERATHKADLEIAKQISDLELSERLTEETLSRLRQPFAGDSRTAMALILLADRSAFLDPPGSELPANPPPEESGQKHLLELAQKFALETLPRLPNLLATRTTFSFDDSPQEVTKGAYAQHLGMHPIGSTKAEVSVNNERSGQASAHVNTGTSRGLTSWGEFGSALLIILSDSSKGKTTWSHWEDTPAGMMAVFHYVVPKNASHFEIDTSVEEMQAQEAPRWAGSRARDAAPVSTSMRTIHSKPGYQGSLWIDPATGTITRLTLVADLEGNPRFERGEILVEYGPVQIAGKTLICPLRSLALSAAPRTVNSTFSPSATEWLNENLFSNYHLFSSSSRIVADVAGASATPSTGSNATENLPAPSADAPEISKDVARSKQSSGMPGSRLDASAGGQPSQAKNEPPPSGVSVEKKETHDAEDANRNAGMEAPMAPKVPAEEGPAQPVAALPAAPPLEVAPLTATADEIPRLRIETPEVLVPVVVRDKRGHAVGNLSKEDFTVIDQGKVTEVRGFSVMEPAAVAMRSTGSAVPPAAPDGGVAHSAASKRFIVFLFDDRHVNSSDLAIAQKAATQMLDEPLASSDYAAVLSLAGTNSGVTQDRGVLQSAIMKVSVHQAAQHGKGDCPDIDYYSADKIVHQHDPNEFQLAVLKAKKCSNLTMYETPRPPSVSGVVDDPGDPFQRMAMAAATRELAAGEGDAQQTLLQIQAVVQAMKKLEGQRILILLSPGFLSLAPDAIAFKSQILDEAADSNVVINALDVRGLYVGNPDASQGSNASLGQFNGNTSIDQLAGMQASENAMAELSNGTGGTYFHNSNDLLGGLKSLAAAPEYVYWLAISLKDVKANGSFHRLQVKVDKPDVDVQARRGYVAPKPANGKR